MTAFFNIHHSHSGSFEVHTPATHDLEGVQTFDTRPQLSVTLRTLNTVPIETLTLTPSPCCPSFGAGDGGRVLVPVRDRICNGAAQRQSDERRTCRRADHRHWVGVVVRGEPLAPPDVDLVLLGFAGALPVHRVIKVHALGAPEPPVTINQTGSGEKQHERHCTHNRKCA